MKKRYIVASYNTLHTVNLNSCQTFMKKRQERAHPASGKTLSLPGQKETENQKKSLETNIFQKKTFLFFTFIYF